jgi:tRNA U38,U39,U40 pseudouridine synthase TruA
MVRRIVGALSEVGRGNMKPSEIIAMMEAGKEAKQFSAPANGLFLEKVYYPSEEVLRGEEAFKLPVLL